MEKKEALKLWLGGKDRWNEKMVSSGSLDINFDGVAFEKKYLLNLFSQEPETKELIDRKFSSDSSICFNGFNFNGSVSFRKAVFSNSTSFCNTKVKDIAVFDGAIFEREVKFLSSEFASSAHFINCEFKGTSSFEHAIFLSEANFSSAKFYSDALFDHARFHKVFEFCSSSFLKRASFQSIKVESRFIDFDDADFSGRLNFEPLNTYTIERLSFLGCKFDNVVVLSGSYVCVPDFRYTKLTHHVDLSEIDVTLYRIRTYPGFDKAEDLDDGSRLCRLKEMADSSKNFKLALKFNALEHKANRWRSYNKMQSILDLMFSIASDYGQSILRPVLILLFSSIIYFFVVKNYQADSQTVSKVEQCSNKDVITQTIATSFPFLEVSKHIRKSVNENCNLLNKHVELSYVHSTLSFFSIFLIGLGLRNRFKI